MSRILLLEDDEALGRGICMALETPNCTVTHCSTRLQAIKILQGVVFDLLILDINLPDGSGLELLRTLRQNGTSTPAILLTANDLELDEVTGLEAGADDMVKEGDVFVIYTDPDALSEVVDALEAKGYTFTSAEVAMVPQNTIKLTDEGDIKNMEKMIDMLEADDDVQNVWHNWEQE